MGNQINNSSQKRDGLFLKALEAVSGNYKGNRAYYEVIDDILLLAA